MAHENCPDFTTVFIRGRCNETMRESIRGIPLVTLLQRRESFFRKILIAGCAELSAARRKADHRRKEEKSDGTR